jgi:hypothetical protein
LPEKSHSAAQTLGDWLAGSRPAMVKKARQSNPYRKIPCQAGNIREYLRARRCDAPSANLQRGEIGMSFNQNAQADFSARQQNHSNE